MTAINAVPPHYDTSLGAAPVSLSRRGSGRPLGLLRVPAASRSLRRRSTPSLTRSLNRPPTSQPRSKRRSQASPQRGRMPATQEALMSWASPVEPLPLRPPEAAAGAKQAPPFEESVRSPHAAPRGSPKADSPESDPTTRGLAPAQSLRRANAMKPKLIELGRLLLVLFTVAGLLALAPAPAGSWGTCRGWWFNYSARTTSF